MEKYHYVYRITNKSSNKFYIGKRTSSIKPEEDLGFFYRSSSTDMDFINEQIQNPNDFTYDVLKKFNSSEDAIEYEIFLHEKYNVSNNPMCYNKSKQKSTGFSTEGTSHDIKTIEKMKTWHANRPEMTDEHCKKISEALKGRKLSEDHIQKLKDAKKNVSKETRKKMSESAKSRAPMSDETKSKLAEIARNRDKDSRKKTSESLKGRTSPMKGLHHSEEAKRKIGEASKERWHNKNNKKS